MFRRCLVAAMAIWSVAVVLASAGSGLTKPDGTVLLRVTGLVDHVNDADGAMFDRPMLEALDWVEIETYTSFTTGPQRFAGPTLTSVLNAVSAQGAVIRATAINDYSVTIPVEHAAQHDVILAMDHNGTPMRVRDKGPIWIVYPQSEREAEKKTFDGEMVWQLVELRIE